MNFVSVIPRGRQFGFSEGSNIPGVSIRDDRTVQNQWRKNAATNAQIDAITAALTKIQNDINRIRARIRPSVQQSEDNFYPFRVYQPQSLTAFVGTMQNMFTDINTGVPTQCIITDQNTPTDLTATPPTVSIADTWRFFCIRSGLVEYRTVFSLVGVNSLIPGDPNNWGYKSFGSDASESIVGTDGVAFADSFGFDSQNFTPEKVLVTGIDPNGITPVSVTLWIQITPDTATTAVAMQIYGTVQQWVDSITAPSWFNSGPNVIPVAEIYFDANNNFEPYQFLFDHVNNRYPGGNGNFSGIQGTVMNFRGFIEGDEQPASGGTATITPSDLNQQFFYPGDIIVVKGYGLGWPENNEQQAIYMFTGAIPAFDINAGEWLTFNYSDNGLTPLDAAAGNPNWTQIFNIPLTVA